MAMEGELPRQPADFAKWVGTVVEANTTLKGLLAKSDKRTVENRVGQVAEGFYVFVAAICEGRDESIFQVRSSSSG
ncbi:hypothetical protein C8R43DRAFT_1143791 [Mycena crocata]|nr:hypothetical protein C8R43DRAFT_1143791 [Mycena crocata]